MQREGHVRSQEEARHKPKRDAPEKNNFANTLISDFQAPEWWGNT